MQMLQLIIGKLENIETRIENIETRMENIETRMENMETRMGKMEIRIEKIENRQENMETRQNEMFEVVKAIEHSNNTHKAEIDHLTYKAAHVEATINGIGEFIIKQKAI